VLAHAFHAAAFLVLALTGMLLLSPALRSLITGGYSTTLATVHRWSGLLLLLPPAAFLMAAGVRRCLAPAPDSGRRARVQAAHVAITLGMTALFLVTGVALWARAHVPVALYDRAQEIHAAATYAALVLLALHLGEVARHRLREPRGGESCSVREYG
jgi:cytochrome b subunit of formate dehydrogenase